MQEKPSVHNENSSPSQKDAAQGLRKSKSERNQRGLLQLCSAFLDLAETSITLVIETWGACPAGYQNQTDKGSRKDGSVGSAGGKGDSSASPLIQKVFAISTAPRGQLEDSPHSDSNATDSLIAKKKKERKPGEANEKNSWELVSSLPFPREWRQHQQRNVKAFHRLLPQSHKQLPLCLQQLSPN